MGKMTNGEDFCREVLNILTCVHKLAPIASPARHFPPSSGEADTKEKEKYSFYYLYALYDILCRILR